jgi:hypothetical protein
VVAVRCQTAAFIRAHREQIGAVAVAMPHRTVRLRRAHREPAFIKTKENLVMMPATQEKPPQTGKQTVTRSGRVSRKPAYLQDYVCTQA